MWVLGLASTAYGICEASDGQNFDDATKLCRRSCAYLDDKVEPPFDLWEQYCVYTYNTEDWDSECGTYYNCIFGCEIFGGPKKPWEGPTATEATIETLRQTLNDVMDKEDKCSGDMCKAFCVKHHLDTCREEQYKSFCEKNAAMGFYKCEIDCSRSSPIGLDVMILFALLLVNADAASILFTIKVFSTRFVTFFCVTIAMASSIFVLLYIARVLWKPPSGGDPWTNYDKQQELLAQEGAGGAATNSTDSSDVPLGEDAMTSTTSLTNEPQEGEAAEGGGEAAAEEGESSIAAEGEAAAEGETAAAEEGESAEAAEGDAAAEGGEAAEAAGYDMGNANPRLLSNIMLMKHEERMRLLY